ncbi:MAG TPA: ATP-binding cassette domain-containing protein [Streptosporangiaceae bacterium]|nr:ATP-binding cassette domain-containing protein [Streptosporangiaceae bacterium]
MAEGAGWIVVAGLTKRFGAVTAVAGLSFTAGPGMVTGFLGPNGAGKTTTLRMLLGLITPARGTATIGGCQYRDLPGPGRVVGAVLEATGFHPGRSGLDHLMVYCTACGYPPARAGEVLDLVGLAAAGRRKVRGYSLGMRQRLALATALLGDPGVLVLDEPANGLDPEGIAWLRGLLRGYADEGRTVLVSSHALAEMEQLADRVVIISAGRLAAEGTPTGLAGGAAAVLVRTPHASQLAMAVAAAGGRAERAGPGSLRVTGLTAAEISRIAAAHRIDLHELTAGGGLEQVYLALTAAPGREPARQPPSGEAGRP